MSTRFEIYCDYHRALKKADQIEQTARNLKKISAEQLNSESFAMSFFWEGPAKDICCDKIRNTSDSILTVYGNLLKIANTIRDIAEKNYKTEMKALEIAEKREY